MRPHKSGNEKLNGIGALSRLKEFTKRSHFQGRNIGSTNPQVPLLLARFRRSQSWRQAKRGAIRLQRQAYLIAKKLGVSRPMVKERRPARRATVL
jgi:hypothetical protein